MVSEFELIEKLKMRFPQNGALVKFGIGDDCAVLPKDRKTDLVITTDLLVEDIDFRLDWSIPEFIGRKALAVSLSDVAAMWAKPAWSMISIGIPENVWKTDFVERFYDGYSNLAYQYGVELIGGDISKTPDKIVIDSIVAGEVEAGKAVFRSGAKIGDLIFVTGPLGGASGGLSLLENGERFEAAAGWRRELITSQLRPIPYLRKDGWNKVNQGLTESTFEEIHSMIDISDGLSSDLQHICDASRVGAKIYAEKIPLSKGLHGLTKNFKEQLSFALYGGEDFELIYTADRKKILSPYNLPFGCIGEITANIGIIELINGQESEILRPGGYRHF